MSKKWVKLSEAEIVELAEANGGELSYMQLMMAAEAKASIELDRDQTHSLSTDDDA